MAKESLLRQRYADKELRQARLEELYRAALTNYCDEANRLGPADAIMIMESGEVAFASYDWGSINLVRYSNTEACFASLLGSVEIRERPDIFGLEVLSEICILSAMDCEADELDDEIVDTYDYCREEGII